jgi:FdhD protein
MKLGAAGLDSEFVRVPVSQMTGDEKISADSAVAREQPLTIILNNKELVTMLCTPMNIDYLAIGFLFSEGFLKSKADIRNVSVDAVKGIARIETQDNIEPESDILFKRVITSGCGRGASFYNISDMQNQAGVKSQAKVSARSVLLLTQQFQRRSEVYQATHGVHSAALCDLKDILVFHEDVGRHNAVDKIFGECLMKDISTEERLIITSGRITSEILLKVAHRNIPLLASMSAPSDLAVKLADDLGITVIGLVRARKMTVYTNDWRVESGGV